MPACGLDFGTSNTTLGVWRGSGPAVREGASDTLRCSSAFEVAAPDEPASSKNEAGPCLLPLEDEHRTIPSAIFFGRDGSVLIGRSAVEAYVDGVEGRLMRSLKSVLGSALLDEPTQIGLLRAPFREVLETFLRGVKRRAEERLGKTITSVVHGRPVHFVDGNPAADRAAEDALRSIAETIGFENIAFQYEPIAAALDYEQHIDREELALIADIGGGTSDFSVVRISPERRDKADRSADILANDGVRVGGTDFDRVLSLRKVMPLLGLGSPMKRRELEVPSRYFHDLASWHSINRVYEPKMLGEIRDVRREAAEPGKLDRLIQVVEERRGHALAGAVEAAKIGLADAPQAAIPLDWIGRGLRLRLTHQDMAAVTAQLAEKIAARIAICLDLAGVGPDRIDALFLTGGSTRLAHVRHAISSELPHARVVEGDTFGSVGLGLAIEAHRRFG